MSIYDEIAHPTVASVSPLAGVQTAGTILQLRNSQLQNQMLAHEVGAQKAIADSFREIYGGGGSSSQPVDQPADQSGQATPSPSLVSMGSGDSGTPTAPAPSSAPAAAPADASGDVSLPPIQQLVQRLSAKGYGDKAQGILTGYAALEKNLAEVEKTKGDVEIQKTDAVAAAAHAAKGDDGHYDPEQITGILAHGAYGTLGSAAARAKLQELHGAQTPDARQAIVDSIGSTLENASQKQQQANSAALTATARGKQADVAAGGLALKQVSNAAAQLATALQRGPWMYGAVWAGLSPNVKDKFPTPNDLDGVTPDSIRQIGMSPAEQNTAANEAATRAETQRYHTVEAGQRAQQIGIEGARNAREQKQFDLTYGQGVDANGQPAISPQAQAIADYRMPPVSPRSMASGPGKALMNEVMRANPAYDATQFPARQKMRQAFTSGPQGQNAAALNTAIEHLGLLHDYAGALSNGSFTPGNAVYNKVISIFGNNAATNFDFARDVMAGELATAMKKSGATDTEISKVTGALSSASSPSQIEGAIRTVALPMIGGKARVLDEQYHATMGEKDPFTIYTPGAKDVLDRLQAQPKEGDERTINGVPAVWKTVNGKTGWYAK